MAYKTSQINALSQKKLLPRGGKWKCRNPGPYNRLDGCYTRNSLQLNRCVSYTFLELVFHWSISSCDHCVSHLAWKLSLLCMALQLLQSVKGCWIVLSFAMSGGTDVDTVNSTHWVCLQCTTEHDWLPMWPQNARSLWSWPTQCHWMKYTRQKKKLLAWRTASYWSPKSHLESCIISL